MSRLECTGAVIPACRTMSGARRSGSMRKLLMRIMVPLALLLLTLAASAHAQTYPSRLITIVVLLLTRL